MTMAATDHRYTRDEKTDVLNRLARNSGSVARTRKQLTEDERRTFPVPSEKTLYRWRDEPGYQSIRKHFERQVDERLAERMTGTIDDGLDLIDDLHAEAKDAVKAKKYNAVRDISTAARNFATEVGIFNTNSRVNREKPLGVYEEHQRISYPELEFLLAVTIHSQAAQGAELSPEEEEWLGTDLNKLHDYAARARQERLALETSATEIEPDE